MLIKGRLNLNFTSNLTFFMKLEEKIGLRVAILRKAKGYSQEALGFESNVNRTYINDLEHGRRNVSVVVLSRLLKGLGITFSEFFKEGVDE
jgi:transcriptional regulator with XRE-family HTH domain